MSAVIIKANAQEICSGLAAANVSATSADAAISVAHAIEALIGATADVAVATADHCVVANFAVEANRHGGIQHLLDTLCPAAGWEGRVEIVDGTTWVQIHMQQAETPAAPAEQQVSPAVVPVAAAPVVQKPAAAPAAALAAPTPAAVVPAAAVVANPADAMAAAITQLMSNLSAAANGATSVIARSEAERNALLAATQAATAATAAAQTTLGELKAATTAAQTAAEAAMAAISAKAAAPAPEKKVEWYQTNVAKVALGVAAVGVVAGAGYYAYNHFFSNTAE